MVNQLLYRKIEAAIRERIKNGTYPPGAQLPTEMELLKEFKTSRLTISKSLSHLVAEGLITRTRGKGSFVKGSTATARPGLIRFVSPVAGDDNNILRNGLLEGIHESVHPAGFSVGIEFYRSLQEELDILRRCRDHENDALVIWPSNDAAVMEILRELKLNDFPFVLVDTFFPQLKCDCIMTDNILGGLIMLEHLAALGHKHVGYFSQALDRFSLAERFAGVLSAAGSLGIELLGHTLILPGHSGMSTPHAGREERQKIADWLKGQMQLPEPPTAILCSNDSLALDLYEILDEMNIKVPGDISIAGFDNVSFGQYLPTPLTTMEHDFTEIGRKAGYFLLNRLQTPKETPLLQQDRVAPRLITRSSTQKRS